MLKHNLKLSDRILKKSDYIYKNYTDLSLKDNVVSYYNGLNWKIVPLNIFLEFPVIHDLYYEEDASTGEIISIAVCPFTLASSAFLGEYKPSEYLLNSSLVLTDNKNNLLPIISGFSTNNDGKLLKIKRWETFIKVFRIALSDYPDCQFIIPTIKLQSSIINTDYYKNENIIYPINQPDNYIHPKTLVYVIQYKSSKTLKDKYSIIIGHDANESEPTGYNTKESGLSKYIDMMKMKFVEKSAFLISQLWFSWFAFYPNAKIIQL